MPLADIILMGGIGATFFILIVAILLDSASRERAKMRRIESIRIRALGRLDLAKSLPGGVNVKVATDEGSVFGRATARWLPRKEALNERLAQTGREISPGRYGTAVLLCIFASFAIAILGLRLSPVLAGLGALAVGLYLPHAIVGYMVRKRAERFIIQFPDAIELMVRGLKSGLPISETVVSVGREMPDPVGVEFRRAADAVRFGQTLEDALWAASKRVATAEFKFFVISLTIQRDTGGNLAETLANLSDVIRKRKQMRLKIRAMSSEARASAYILGSLPFMMFGIIMLINRSYAMTLFTDPRGVVALCVGLTLIGLAIGTMYKLVKFEI